MFTTCPGCRMNLAVTAMDLRVGQGYVRCGRCDRVFNALLSLSEEVDPEDQSGHAATGTATVPALDEEELPSQAPAPPTSEPMPPPPELAAEQPPEAPPDLPPLPATAYVPDVDLVESTATGTFETIVLEGDGYLQTEEHIDEEELEQQLQQIARQIDDGRAAAEAEAEPAPAFADELAAAPPPAEVDANEAVGNRPHAHWAWAVAAVLLALTLGAQVVHHNRQQLVAIAWLEQPLRSVYGLFGQNLEPAWDLAAYDLRQLGGEEMGGTGTTIVLRASVHNQSPNRQPPPLIRAVLKDRYGNAIATRDIAPRDYLRSAAPARMAPDQRLDVELALEDPNRQAVGYELDTCLPSAGGGLHCSNDP